MFIIKHSDICNLNIDPQTCIKWVTESFRIKPEAQLPPKSSLHPQGTDFFNTMPCMLPPRYGRFAVKEVHRIAGQVPSLGSDLLLYDSCTGELLAMMDADWITTMRTGAVAALATCLLEKSNVQNYSFLGLGNTARAVALCVIADHPDTKLYFRILHYKDQAEKFIERFQQYPKVTFDIVDSTEDLVADADVLFSCITDAQELICADEDKFKKGVLVIPVHTKGFQNCDLFFDKVFGDDTGHIEHFRYFNQFKEFHELTDVLLGKAEGRTSDSQRILAYNIGLGLHDAIFASKLYDLLDKSGCQQIELEKETRKFWI